jgi:hypothetical protein
VDDFVVEPGGEERRLDDLQLHDDDPSARLCQDYVSRAGEVVLKGGAMRVSGVVVALLLSCVACDRHASSGGLASAPNALVPADVKLATSRSTTLAPGNAVVVVLSPTRVALDRDGPPLAVPDPATWDKGLDVKYKRGSRNDYGIVPLEAALEARRPDGSAPELVVAADASVPNRLLVEALYTIGQSWRSNVALLVQDGASAHIIEIDFPKPGRQDNLLADVVLGSDGGEAAAHLHLRVVVQPDGFVVSGGGRRIAEGCRGAGGAVAVPKRDGAYDFAGLTACATTLKGSSPSYADEVIATVSGSAATDTQTFVSTIDALRGPGAQLFPQIQVGVSH